MKNRSNASVTLQKFTQKNIPFARDAGDNDYWIELSTGRIKYTHSTVPNWADNIINVAPSFYDFCLFFTDKKANYIIIYY